MFEVPACLGLKWTDFGSMSTFGSDESASVCGFTTIVIVGIKYDIYILQSALWCPARWIHHHTCVHPVRLDATLSKKSSRVMNILDIATKPTPLYLLSCLQSNHYWQNKCVCPSYLLVYCAALLGLQTRIKINNITQYINIDNDGDWEAGFGVLDGAVSEGCNGVGLVKTSKILVTQDHFLDGEVLFDQVWHMCPMSWHHW